MAYKDIRRIFVGLLNEKRTSTDTKLHRLLDSVEYLDWTEDNVQRFKSTDNMLSHARTGEGVEGFIIVKGRTLVGYAAWEDKTLIAFEVAGKYRGIGVGKHMMSRCKRNGVDNLTVDKNNYKAIALYIKTGFAVTSRRGKMYNMRLTK